MEDSPMLSPIIREYASKFKIEDVLNEMINEVLKTMPDDPFAMMNSIIKTVSY